MLAIELVEVAIVGRVMLRPVPPVPVTAFGNQQLFPGDLALLFGHPMRMTVIVIARFRQQVPSEIVLWSADPYVEVGIDPRARHQTVEPPKVRLVVPRDRLRNRDGLNLRIALESVVE